MINTWMFFGGRIVESECPRISCRQTVRLFKSGIASSIPSQSWERGFANTIEIWIPAEIKHRLSSAGPEVRVLEIAFGNWQQEDIARYDDDYQRPKQGEQG